MKKLFAIMFTVFYFGFSSGMVYNDHFCMNKAFKSLTKSTEKCKLCDAGKKKDGCRVQVKVLKTDVAQKAEISSISNAPFAIFNPKIFYSNFLSPVLERNYFSIPLKAPPNIVGPALFISYRNFRI